MTQTQKENRKTSIDRRIVSKSRRADTPSRSNRQLTFCAICIALATVTSFIKIVSLPFGGSITLFSMLFISLTGYFYGLRAGILTGTAFGILQFILNPYVYAPIQILLDYPLAFGALGFSGFFCKKKYGLLFGYSLGVTGRYLFHVISGYLFFQSYAPEGTNALLYTLGYNLTYILPEMILTLILLCIPSIRTALTKLNTNYL